MNSCSNPLPWWCLPNACSYGQHPLAYVCNGENGHIAVVDLLDARYLMTIDCGPRADTYYIVINPICARGYVIDYNRRLILTLDLQDNCVINIASVPFAPRGLALSPCGCFLYVVFDNAALLQVYCTHSLRLIQQIVLPGVSDNVEITNGGQTAYITQPDLNQTAVVDLPSGLVVQLLNTGIRPGRMALERLSPLAVVGGRDSHTLTPIDTQSHLVGADIDLGGAPSGMTFLQNTSLCLVALQRQEQAAVVDMRQRQVIKRIAVGDLPGGVAASIRYPLAVVTNALSENVSIIDTRTLESTHVVVTGGSPRGVAVYG